MQDKLLIFDLDGTLLDTKESMPFRKSNEGRNFLYNNIPLLIRLTKIFDTSLIELFNRYAREGRAGVCTNSPEYHARILLSNFGFENAPLIFAANKPSHDGLIRLIYERGINPRNILSIGDKAIDILASHGSEIASVAVTWGDDSEDQLIMSEPQRIVRKPEDLEGVIRDFDLESFGYMEREYPDNFIFLPSSYGSIDFDENSIYSVGEYKPYHGGEFDQFSAYILDFKRVKQHTPEEINNGYKDVYFAGGILRESERPLLHIINGFKKAVADKVNSLGIKGRTLIIGAPNSFPRFCYKSDTNHIFVRMVSSELGDGFHSLDQRFVSRVYPLQESHSGYRNMPSDHFRTMGFQEFNFDYDAIIVFDDVTTTSSQLRSIYTLLRYSGFDGRIYSVTLGKTR